MYTGKNHSKHIYFCIQNYLKLIAMKNQIGLHIWEFKKYSNAHFVVILKLIVIETN